MRDAKNLLIASVAALALTLSACGTEQQPDDNQIITDINQAEPGDIEALPPGETVDPMLDDEADRLSPEERGDGDDMVNIIDDTGNRA